ncbi:hypothetical protein [Evansella clarkii]|uniref:hypothetical protein n=1 Tax=Evansella clarkii TaxID=79879 RepID=UPI0009961D80|nr:hypothetical protein [Evansella clarkii]
MEKEAEILVPKVTSPIRVMFMFESTGWFDTTKEYKEEVIIPELKEIIKEWEKNGAKLIGTIDADVLAAGRTGQLGWHACFLYDVPDLSTITAMTHAFRARELDRYFRIEAVIGRPFVLLEEK